MINLYHNVKFGQKEYKKMLQENQISLKNENVLVTRLLASLMLLSLSAIRV